MQAITSDDGSVTVLLGGQVPLVTGDKVHAISLRDTTPEDAANPSAPPRVSVVDENGSDVTQKIADGQLGALLSVRNQVIPHLIGGPSESGELNVLAKQIADAVNNTFISAGGQARLVTTRLRLSLPLPRWRSHRASTREAW